MHKTWGKSTRVSEVDKKEIQVQMATYRQAAKEAWKRHLEHTRQQLDHANDFKYSEYGKMKGLMEKIKTYLRIQVIFTYIQ